MRVGDRHAVRPGFERRIDPRFGDDAVGDREADFVGLVAGGDGGGEGRRYRLPGMQRAMRGAAALAAGEGAHQAGGDAARRRRVMGVGDVDRPSCLCRSGCRRASPCSGPPACLARAGRSAPRRAARRRASIRGAKGGAGPTRRSYPLSHRGHGVGASGGADDLTGGCDRQARGAPGGPPDRPKKRDEFAGLRGALSRRGISRMFGRRRPPGRTVKAAKSRPNGSA